MKELYRGKTEKFRELDTHLVVSPVRKTVSSLREIHAADAAEWLGELEMDTFTSIMQNFPSNAHSAQILLHLPLDRSSKILSIYTPYRIATLVNHLEGDDSNEVLQKLPDHKIRNVLRYLSKNKRQEFLSSMKHERGTAGRLMVRNPITCLEDETVSQVLNRLQSNKDLPETLLDIFVLDKNQRVAGVAPLGKIVASGPKTKIKTIANRVEHVFSVDTPVESIIDSFQQYDTTTAPVIDSEGKIVGFITVDEVLDWADMESEQKAPKMFGVDVEEDKAAKAAVFRRFSWLCLNLVIAIAIGGMVSLFEGEIAKIAAIAALMPIVASMSSTATCQSASIMIRSLGPGIVKKSSIRTGRKEIYFSIINAFVFGIMVLVFVTVWKNWELGILSGLSILASIVVAGLVGVAVPVILAKMKLDPAVGSSIIITSITDAISFITILGGAAFLLLQ